LKLAQIQPASLPVAIAELFLAILAMSGVDVIVRHLGLKEELSSQQILLLSSLIGIAFLLPVMAKKGPSLFQLKRPRLFLFRGLVAFGSTFAMYSALIRLPLAEANTLFSVETMFLVILGAVFLKESITTLNMVTVVLSIAGVVLVMNPQGSIDLPGGSMAIIAGFFLALKTVLMKSVAQNENTEAALLWLLVISALMSLPFAASNWQSVSMAALGLIALTAVFRLCCQWLMIRAFRRASVADLAPVFNLGIPIALVQGYAFFGELPQGGVWIGITLIFLAVVLPSLKIKWP
jgi:drug/metabolite transporter (DMT)-like permease